LISGIEPGVPTLKNPTTLTCKLNNCPSLGTEKAHCDAKTCVIGLFIGNGKILFLLLLLLPNPKKVSDFGITLLASINPEENGIREPFVPGGPDGPVGPVQPVAPVWPVGPVHPVAPVDPVDPVGPVQPVEPVAPVLPVGPVQPVEPVGPVDPVCPVGPVKPVDPVCPVDPVEPVCPVCPVDPVKPVEPVSPGSPCGPSSQWGLNFLKIGWHPEVPVTIFII